LSPQLGYRVDRSPPRAANASRADPFRA
jgi:hypothetical protein